jgi:hypothetical protein
MLKLTSSNFAAALGLNPYMSRQKLFRILTERQERDPINDMMQWGIDHEKDAVAGVEAITGILFDYTGENQQHFTGDWMDIPIGTTPDGLCLVSDNKTIDVGLEVKCPVKMYDSVPIHYMPQVQGQASIIDFGGVYFSAWTPESQRVWVVPASVEYATWMLPLLAEFMDYLDDDEEPKRKKKVIPPEVKYEELI